MAEASEENEVTLENLDQELKAALGGEVPEESIEEVPQEEYSEKEQKAMALGWNPDEESLKGSDKDWIPADEFLRNQTFFTEIKKLKRDARSQRKVVEAFKQQNQIVADKAYDKAVKDLKAKKVQAAEEEDFGKILRLDDEIDELNTTRQTEQASTAAEHTKEEWDTAFEDFVDDNAWYSDNRVMRSFADTLGMEYVKSHPRATPDELYEHVMKEISTEFKDEGKPEKQPRAQKVVTPTRRTRPSKAQTHTIDDIPDEHKKVAMTLIKSKAVSEEDYLKQYFPEDYS